MKRPNRRVMEAERFYRIYYKTAWGISTPAKRGKRARSSKSQVVMGALVVVTLLALLALPRISHAALNVDVFTTSQFPIVDAQAQSGATIHVYKLDGVKNTLSQINSGLQGLSPSPQSGAIGVGYEDDSTQAGFSRANAGQAIRHSKTTSHCF